MADTTSINGFISLEEAVNNFVVSYTGTGRLIPDFKRAEVVLHAKRCLQEFAYDTIKSQFSKDYTGAGVSHNLPEDFVSIIEVVDSSGNRLVQQDSSPPVTLGKFYLDYNNDTIILGDTGTSTVKYLSNILTLDESVAIPKLAEEALYICMAYSILSNRPDTPPAILQKLMVEKTKQLEKSKSRLVFTNFSS
jgi:hypothetical protein